MAFVPTIEQGKAIEAKGNILVSAAAGSGKTAVLVERVIKKLCSKTDSVSADKLLIVTFTNAAAAEMRSRIEKRLDEECRKNPDDVSLLFQKHLLPAAKICTIDSFCIDLVRENFEKLNIAPDFKMSDANSLRPIDESVLQQIVNRYLEENNPLFLELLDIIGAEYDEKRFISFVLELFNYSRQLPFPKSWYQSFADYYKDGKFSKASVWYKYAFSKALELIKDAQNSLSTAIDLLTVSESAVEGYTPVFSDLADNLYSLKEIALKEDWDEFYKKLINFAPLALPKNVKGVTGIFEVNAAKDIYKYITSKPIEKLQRIFYADLEFINRQYQKIAEPIKLLADILIEFDDALFEEYKKNATFTFHNTEHLALQLLCEEKNGEFVIKEDAEELFIRFEEVMVDEFQDTNDLQDLLFYCLSNKEKNLFVVGDVKQSIYGFRGANPKNFLSKKNRYIPIEKTTDEMPQKIILGKNFRCKAEVCDFINFFFYLFMSEETGDIIYNDEEKLIRGANYPELDKNPCEYHLIEAKGNAEHCSKVEAKYIAEYIRKTMAEGDIIRVDDNTLRPAKYSDFTILLRSAKNKAPALADELKRQGIPANFSIEGFAECAEISTFLSLLAVIDNPQSDIDLLSVLMSPIFSFSADELAKLRINKRDGNLYSAVVYASQNGDEKCQEFLKKIEKFRIISVSNPLPKLISILLNVTGYLDIVSVMTDGSRRRNNLLLLVSYAESYTASNTESIGGFVKYIIKQSEIGLKCATASSGGDSVKIMSIHGSKGLQFPICIIADITSDFNDSEARSSTLYSTDFGIGFKYYDEELKQPLTTVGREVILNRTRTLRLEEELRLLYVAMTRTQDRLVFIGTVSDINKKANDTKTMLISTNSEINSSLFARTKSYNDWLMLSLMVHPSGKELRGNGSSIMLKETDSNIKVYLINENDIQEQNVTLYYEETESNKEIGKAISDNLAFEYPYKELLNIESKASVSKLANSAESAKFAFTSKPSFMNKSGLTAAEKGTAMHKVMQFFDFSKHNSINEELERLYEWQFLSEREIESIDKNRLKSFFESAIFKRILASGKVEREMRFLTEVDAKKIAPTLKAELGNEKIIVQGAVDICFVEDDGIVILDFKTDRVDNLEELSKTYGEQLNIYALACEKIFEKPVKEKVIYSFYLSDEIKLK